MNKFWAGSLFLALLAGGLVAAPLAASPAMAVSPASPATPMPMERFTFAGRLPAHSARLATLQAYQGGGRWTAVASSRTARNGTFTFTVHIGSSPVELRGAAPAGGGYRANTTYPAVIRPAAQGTSFSAPTAAGASSVQALTATAHPARNGRGISLEQYDFASKTWSAIASGRVNASGSGTFHHRLPATAGRAEYRIRMAGYNGAGSVTSSPRLVTVTTAKLPAAHTAPARNAPGTTVSSKVSQQVMVADRTGGTKGTWARYEWNGTSWVRLDLRGTDSIFGGGGVAPAAQRRQNTATTPAGTFGFVSAFGTGNLGTKLPYRKVTSCSWWVEDPAQRDYNRWRESCSGKGLNRSDDEHLADYTGSMYRQAAVIDYNYYAPQKRSGAGSGAGIFLHYATSHTGGCVGLNSHTELDRTIAWMDPAKHPKIVVKS